MTPGRALALSLCTSAVLLAAGCVEYVPVAADSPPPPPPPAYAPEYAPAPPQAPAQAPAYASLPPPPPEAPPPAEPAPGLDRLLRPIALYPDPLLALILPASTYPGELAAAQAYLVQYGDPSQVDAQPWDPSVRALAHYPTVIQWLAENPAWTQALGAAFLQSPGAVVEAVQRLRRVAVNSGALSSNPEQQVVFDGSNIDILPGAPNAIYVPAYDGDAVFQGDSEVGYQGDYINYGPAYPVGPWLTFCVDWNTRGVWVGGWNAWHGPSGPHVPHFDAERRPPHSEQWHRQPSAASPPPVRQIQSGAPPKPIPMRGAPRASQGQARVPARTPPAQAEPEKRPTPLPRERLPASETRVPQQPPATAVPRPIEPAPRQYPNSPVPATVQPRSQTSEPSRTEPSRAEPARTEPSRTEPARAEPARTEPSRTEPPRAEPARTEPSRAEPARTEPSRAEPSHDSPHPAPAPAPAPAQQSPTQNPSR
jgi:hypothetical protein